MNAESAPVAESQRIGLLDFLRGVAILGILTVNIYSFGLPGLGYLAPYAWGENTPLDDMAFSASIFLFQQKMYPLLAFLFGVGIFLLTEKEDRIGRSSTGVFMRRMGMLATIGLLHALLLWHGDILVWYSIAGVFAYLMRKMSDRLLLFLGISFIWGISIFCCSPSIATMHVFPDEAMPNLAEFQEHPASFEDAAPLVDQPYWENFMTMMQSYQQTPTATALEAHYQANGTWLEILPHRAFAYFAVASSALLAMIPMLTGIMLLGILAGRAGFLVTAAPAARIRIVVLALGLLVGVPVCALAVNFVWVKSPAWLYSGVILNMVGGPLMAGMYVVILSFLHGLPPLRLVAYPIECVGRMAMSNYLGQTIVFVTLFQGWGFGWFGQLGYAELAVLVVGCWVVQMAVSVVWMQVFRFGPLEWVWRSATYGRFQPMWRSGGSLGD